MTTASAPTDAQPAVPVPVTVIGLGEMGFTLASAFLAGGHPTTVWNRTPERADALVAKGARRAATVREAVAAGFARGRQREGQRHGPRAAGVVG
ncbi:NAD(P)-binding domain-containing protein [Streptomyces sp. SBC-4]|nr:NAD(P)-binding domain-containing protein [Streptomyces sp. SBC-4]MDV5142759.1 NAD(P)-binding domain-containing protein [Streptomyces sp. SBC-4]